jgi:NAD(P)-dependent dehydrogenase (short-subunit alcohol dehydrogenase family)
MSVVLITGASSGIGNLTARALVAAGHTVYASMRDVAGRNRPAADELLALGRSQSLDLRVVDLDVRSQESADAAVAAVIDEAGRLDVVVHNAGHLSLGYTEAYSAEEMADLLDVNALGAQRINRAALPHMRAQGTGTLVYIGSTTTVSVPPFLGPYVVSKFAFDALAQVTAYEVAPYGIETVIVMPGAFTRGTNHFAHASGPADQSVTAEYADLDHYVASYGEATEGLFAPGSDPDPASVAAEVARVLALPIGQKPRRTIVDFTQSSVERVTAAAEVEVADFLTRMGMGELLQVARRPDASGEPSWATT